MARQTYTKSVEEWKNKPDKTTPIMAENLNKIEQGIKDAMDSRALKELYDDYHINFGRKTGSISGYKSATIGTENTASGEACVAIGNSNTASSTRSLATGSATKATGTGSLTAGYGTQATKAWSVATGYSTQAKGEESFTQGKYTIAEWEAQFVCGKYNKSENRALIVGGGTSETDRKNLFSLDWSGNVRISGDVTTDSGASLNSIGIPANTDIDFSNYFL